MQCMHWHLSESCQNKQCGRCEFQTRNSDENFLETFQAGILKSVLNALPVYRRDNKASPFYK